MSDDDKVSKPHDGLFKYMLTDRDMLISFVRTIVPSHIAKHIDFSSFKATPGNFVNEALRQSHTDALFQTKFAGKLAYIYFLMEHQSTPDEKMTLRCPRYITSIQENHMRIYKTKKPPFVFPIVFYNGKVKYNYPTDLLDMIDAPKELLADYSISKFHLVDLHDIADEELRESTWANLLIFTMKHAYDREIAKFIREFMGKLEQMNTEELETHSGGMIFAVVTYIMNVYRALDKEQFMQALKQSSRASVQEAGMTLAEQFAAEGETRAKQQIILNLLKRGMSAKEISDITKVPLEKIPAKGKVTVVTD